jgi:hypothetical protein
MMPTTGMPAESIEPMAAIRSAVPIEANSTRLVATIATADGRFVTGGVAAIARRGDEWTATVRQLDQPGAIASLYFGEREREVILRTEDGRRARARIAGTSFIAGGERVCRLTGVEPLA